MKLELPKWHKDLEVNQGIKTAFIVEGNVHDMQGWVSPEEGSFEYVSMDRYLYLYLSGRGYDGIAFYNRSDGFYNDYSEDSLKQFYQAAKSGAERAKTIDAASVAIRAALENKDRPVAVVMNLINTMLSSPSGLSDTELAILSRLFLATKAWTEAPSSRNGRLLNNTIFFIVEKANDLPAWFYINNPYIKILTVSKPGKEVRRSYIAGSMDCFSDADALSGEALSRAVTDMANLTEGMTNLDLFGVLSVCEQRGLSVHQMRDAINLIKYGEMESYWDRLDADVIEHAEETLSRRVKGQPNAVRKAADILCRACSGMSGAQGSAAGKPKGVLFFAGPTGTGKTELAKSIAEMVFGDESFVTRFDMSEYQQSHSDQKLMGAPPGYIGYDAGGQLTNAVKERPFTILLFDEIDKAHPSILDKFLQILDDGRMTDSSGETVYFSETLIIFTSNLGVIEKDPRTGESRAIITPEMPYEEMEKCVMESIRKFFHFGIGRPELMNRIGNNFVVFDFIREEMVDPILDIQLRKVATSLQDEKGIRLEIPKDGAYYRQLHELACGNLTYGGRGIGNVVESYLVNPLSRLLFRERLKKGDTIRIEQRLREDLTLEARIEHGAGE